MMHDYKLYVVTLGFVLGGFCSLAYVVGVLRGKTKPHLYSWLIWTVLAATIFFGQISDGGGKGAWIMLLNSLQCLLILLLSFKYGEKHIARSDHLSLAAAFAAILLWPLTKTPLYSVALVTLIDAIGFLPTFRKAWAKPYEENVTSFSLSLGMYICGLAALENYSFITAFYPAVITVVHVVLVVYLLWRRTLIKNIS